MKNKMIDKMIDDLFTDPLDELFELYEQESMRMKPQVMNDLPGAVAGPNKGEYEHPVIQKRNELDNAIDQGQHVIDSHEKIHGQISLDNIDHKSKLAGTLGRIQNEVEKQPYAIETDKKSLLAIDNEIEKEINAVTQNDLENPMRSQVPDKYQTPQDQVTEETEEFYNKYLEDVEFLRKYGRA